MSVEPRAHVTGHKAKCGWLSLGVTQAPEACDLQKEGKWEGAALGLWGMGGGEEECRPGLSVALMQRLAFAA